MKIGIGFMLLLAAKFAFAQALDCSKKAGTVPNPALAIGSVNESIPVEHVIVIMQENHSFDAYFGRLNQPQYYGSEIDGVSDAVTNPDKDGNPVHAYHETNLCIPDTDHMWNAEHMSWDHGKNDGFVKTNGARTLAYYDQTDLPFYYELANQFAVADRYFCSAMTSTYPNRYFLMAATAFGHYTNDEPADDTQFSQRTIFDVMTDAQVSWKYYTDDQMGYLQLFRPMWKRNQDKMMTMEQLKKDLEAGTLPKVTSSTLKRTPKTSIPMPTCRSDSSGWRRSFISWCKARPGKPRRCF
jgi:phospholipase C